MKHLENKISFQSTETITLPTETHKKAYNKQILDKTRLQTLYNTISSKQSA